jgi:hypothetical protein
VGFGVLILYIDQNALDGYFSLSKEHAMIKISWARNHAHIFKLQICALLHKISIKKMKALLILCISLIILPMKEKCFAQTATVTSGVYITAKDYKKNKLNIEADCGNDKDRFERNDYFWTSNFVVIHKGKRVVYQKKDIYAYRDCNNRVWRFYNNQAYQIMEQKSIYIYTTQKIILNDVVVEKDPVVYFSVGQETEIKELTIANLKLAYADNWIFLNMLQVEPEPEKAVRSYDAEHKMYRVNYLYKHSKKEK